MVTPEISAALDAALALVRDAGYLVVKVPPCNKRAGHGRHSLVTRSAMCEGVEPIPHGFRSRRMGSFGMWVDCLCGHGFADYSMGDEPSPWEQHKTEHAIVEGKSA